MKQEEIIKVLAKIKPQSTFLSLIGYRNEHSEIADHNIIFHISYESALQKSINILEEYNPLSGLESKARDQLLDSYSSSLKKMKDPIKKIENGYKRFFNEDNEYIKGIKLHLTSNILHVYGFSNFKRIRILGIYPEQIHKDLTIAKNKISKLCPVSKFRQFKITPFNLDHLTVNNLIIFPA